MTNFLVLYRGHTISESKMVAVTIDPEIVAYVAKNLLGDEDAPSDSDPVLRSVESGRSQALRLVSTEAAHASA